MVSCLKEDLFLSLTDLPPPMNTPILVIIDFGAGDEREAVEEKLKYCRYVPVVTYC